MKPDPIPAAIDNPQGPEFASWRSYQRFEGRVRLYRCHILDKEIKAFLDTVKQTWGNRNMLIPEGKLLWRAQLGVCHRPSGDPGAEDVEVPIGFDCKRMKPPADHSREGRANSPGVPVLYLASTKQTAISEVRPWVGSEVSVGEFRTTRRLNVINLTKGHSKYSWEALLGDHFLDVGAEDGTPEAKERAVWIEIDNAFSRPVALTDGQENYIPTRILAELFQEAGYNGIVYRSQVGQEGRDGYNIALFRLEDAELRVCTPYEVKSIQVEAEPHGNPWFASWKQQ